jgi:predicted nucleic acid-binding protein
MQNRYAADTMALILYLEKRKLSKVVANIFSEVENGNIELIIPAMAVAELAYLAERERIDTNLIEVRKLLTDIKNVKIEPLKFEIIEAAFKIKSIPELHDRLITATAAFYNSTLITNDPIIQASGSVKVIW